MRRYIIINDEIYVEFPEAKNGSNGNISVHLVPISEVNSDLTKLISTNDCNSDVQNSELNEMQSEFSISKTNCNEDSESVVDFHKRISDEYLNNTSNSNYMNSSPKSHFGLRRPSKEKFNEDSNDSLVIDLTENEELLEDNAGTVEKINKLYKPVELKFKYERHRGLDIKVGDYFPINNFSLSPENIDEHSLLNDSKFIYKCPYCSYKYPSSLKFYRHIIAHIEPCFCSSCDSAVPLKKINFHIRRKHVKTIRCLVCSFETKKEGPFRLHLVSTHRKEMMAKCSICGCALEKKKLLLPQIEILSNHVKDKHSQQTYRAS
ncbi:uncharacterized protein LOC123682635 isoform X2 [Harmonia axyridis]|uniref:uncharacterized protein LOC123682635 isoform X2 n=1 Tax=Harmonia axyridis TaxID=115357 RepID=UPI001E279535|nr:uncharacterized protein LOC123682635 isoform X2 [Harmonia axyridis]